MPAGRNNLPPYPSGFLSLANINVLLRSLREYREALEFLELEGRGDSKLARYLGEQIKKLEEELRQRGIKHQAQ